MDDQLMKENFFIEDPEKLENKFFDVNKEFSKNFKEKSEQFVQVMSKKNRHAKKLNKNRKDQNIASTSAVREQKKEVV